MKLFRVFLIQLFGRSNRCFAVGVTTQNTGRTSTKTSDGTMIGLSGEKCVGKRRRLMQTLCIHFQLDLVGRLVWRTAWLIRIVLIDLSRSDPARARGSGLPARQPSRSSIRLSSAKTAPWLWSQFVIGRRSAIRNSFVTELIQVARRARVTWSAIVDIHRTNGVVYNILRVSPEPKINPSRTDETSVLFNLN